MICILYVLMEHISDLKGRHIITLWTSKASLGNMYHGNTTCEVKIFLHSHCPCAEFLFQTQSHCIFQQGVELECWMAM